MSSHPPSPAPSPPAPPSGDPWAWLDALPGAVLGLDAEDRVTGSNATARSWLGPLAAPGTALRSAIGLEPGEPAPDPRQLPGGRWVSLRRSAPGAALRLLQMDDAQAHAEALAAHARDRAVLNLAQRAGRIGTWERDARTLEGRWDRHVHRFWGHEVTDGTPDFDRAMEQIVEDDREPMRAAFAASLRAPGTYSHRYRVRRPDGGISHLHSHWEVVSSADGAPGRVHGVILDDTEAVTLARAHDALQSQLALAADLAGLVLLRQDLRLQRCHFNRAGWRLMGREPDPAGMSAAETAARLHPDDVAVALRARLQATRGIGPVDAEVRVVGTDGSWRRVLIRGVAERDEDGTPGALLLVGMDITERTSAERRARELGTRFDLAVRTAGIGYWSLEGDAERAEWSDQMRSLHGLAPEEAVPTLKEWLARFVHIDERAEVSEQFRAWLSGRAPQVRSEFRIVRADGSVRRVMTNSLLQSAAPHQVLFGIVVDVTERRLADQALRRAVERAALAARGAGIGTWELDRETGAVYWDEQMWRLRGREPASTAPDAEGILAFVHPADVDAARRQMRQASRRDDIVDYEFRVLWPDGSVRWLASRSATVRDAEGHVERRIGVNWDVTSARQAGVERREREAAEQANAAKSRFLARMSHELRTPLNAVLGFTQLLKARPLGDTEHDWLGHVESAGRHLMSLINDVLDLASLDTGELRIEMTAVDLNSLVTAALPLLEPMRAEHDVQVVLDLPRLQLWSDPVRLRQVLLNLLSNALKYNRPQGTVRISAAAQGGLAVLRIEDSGRGMSAEQLGNLFEPFNRLGLEREGIEGTGIGLSIVKALVDRLGGTIDVRSQVGEGSCFELRLPLADTSSPLREPGAAADPLERLPPLQPAHGLLYVEDNTVNALLLQEMMLRRPDIPLLLAADGQTALAMAREARPALVLTDMHLPDMDGIAVATALQRDPVTAEIPVVALSASALDEDRQRALAAGMSGYWTKPLDAAEFAAAIDRLFGPMAT